MSVIAAIVTSFDATSQNKLTFPGWVDGTGAGLTNLNGSVTITIKNAAGVVQGGVSAAAMTYSGTPGTWTYTGLAAAFPNTVLSITMIGYDQTGATQYLQQDVTAIPNPPAAATYSLGSINTFTLAAFSLPGGALLDNTNSLARISIADRAGNVVLAATNMTYASAKWTYNAAASLFLTGLELIVTMTGYDQTGTTTYVTTQLIATSGG